MSYKITILELVDREIIRDDQPHEFMNKMTDEELKELDKEIWESVKNDKEPGVKHLSRIIDRSILYDVIKLKK